ncbi:MAG: GDP-mannose 4,6-dehydratase [Methanomicrobiales archaeon]|nr:GDP-mannose 4,6-dehydratase [Methanomicrobiales archaeon]
MERVKTWRGRRVFVTGATGVIGLHLTRALERYGADVTVLVRDWVPRARSLGEWLDGKGNVTVVRGDLADRDLLSRVLAEYETEFLFHLGAQTIVRAGNVSPVTTFAANIAGTWNLLEAARTTGMYDGGLSAICVASSDKAYGTAATLPYTEKMPLCGEHPYDVSKSCTDLIARSYAVTYDLPVCIARMGNIYGPGDLNFNRIIPGTIRSVLEGKAPVIRSDGTPVREYFYVADAVDAYLTMAERIDRPGVRGQAFNFSSGERCTVREVVDLILSRMGSRFKPRVLATSRHEIQEQYLSIAKARKVLKWKPRTRLAGGLEETIAWYREVLA